MTSRARSGANASATAVASYLDAHLALRRGEFDLDVALRAQAGRVVAILGPNGSGKTSALLALAGLLPLDGGSVRVDGVTWADVAAGVNLEVSERHTGLVLADPLLFPHLTAEANVAFGPRSRAPAPTRSAAPAHVTPPKGVAAPSQPPRAPPAPDAPAPPRRRVKHLATGARRRRSPQP